MVKCSLVRPVRCWYLSIALFVGKQPSSLSSSSSSWWMLLLDQPGVDMLGRATRLLCWETSGWWKSCLLCEQPPQSHPMQCNAMQCNPIHSNAQECTEAKCQVNIPHNALQLKNAIHSNAQECTEAKCKSKWMSHTMHCNWRMQCTVSHSSYIFFRNRLNIPPFKLKVCCSTT